MPEEELEQSIRCFPGARKSQAFNRQFYGTAKDPMLLGIRLFPTRDPSENGIAPELVIRHLRVWKLMISPGKDCWKNLECIAGSRV